MSIGFEYDFRGKLESLIVDIQKEYIKNVDNMMQENLNLDIREYLNNIINLRYVDSLNICTSVLLDYHKTLMVYLNESIQAKT